MDVMNESTLRRRTWHGLTRQEKEQRLAELRRHQQHQIEIELRYLRRR